MSQLVEELKCEAVLELIEEFVDESLDDDTVEAARHHINGCASCAREHANAERVLSELRSLPSFEPPQRVLERVAAVADAESVTPSGINPFLRRTGWLAAAATVVLAIGAGSFFHHQSSSAKAEALRAAAEVRFAIATIGDISRRANRIALAKVTDEDAVPKSIRGLAHTLRPLTSTKTTDGPSPAPYEPAHEGSS